jgi:rSAM/selenodomain-associated transferase 1
MERASMREREDTRCCVVLMMKAPARSKRRLVEHLGAQRATEIAERLLDCAREDLAAWAGPKCVAPSTADERADAPPADTVVVQRDGNLGERIQHVNAELLRRGFERQLYVGIDCPSLDAAYLERAAVELDRHDIVLGPATDGGVVLMGVRGAWPELAKLPWSTSALFESLLGACAAEGSTAVLPRRSDVDTVEDLVALRGELVGDSRPARRALAVGLAAQPGLRE